MSAPPKIRFDPGGREERDEDEKAGEPSPAPPVRLDHGGSQKRIISPKVLERLAQETMEKSESGKPDKSAKRAPPKPRKDRGGKQKRAAKRKPKRAAPKVRRDRGGRGVRK